MLEPNITYVLTNEFTVSGEELHAYLQTGPIYLVSRTTFVVSFFREKDWNP